ncbi:pilus assembly protein PilM [bacterium]|nr:pilus assembly protein PilM [bacterium]MBU1634130.1 pilus assembly protein PilM [bacterium]MBU1875399.1 pilus assembly protein PilM [bacterium]
MLSKGKKSVGVDIGSNVIKIIGLRRKKKIRIEFMKLTDLYMSKNVRRPEDLSDTLLVQVIRGLISEIKGGVRKFKTSVSGQDALVRSMELPNLSNSEIQSAIKWKLASTIPFDIDDVEFDFQVLNTNKSSNMQTVLVGIVPANKMKKHLDILTRANLEPEIVEIDSLAIYNCFITLQDLHPDKTVAILNIGAACTTLIIMHPDHDPLFNSIAIGGNTLTRSIESTLHISFIDAEREKIEMNYQASHNTDNTGDYKEIGWKGPLLSMVAKLAEEIKKADIYYQILYGEEGLQRIYLTGGGAKLKNLDYLLANAVKVPVALWNPLKSEKLECKQEIENIDELGLHFATSLGLALRDEL